MTLSPTIALAQQLIRKESVTPADEGCQELIAHRLAAVGFNCERMRFDPVTNLWATHTGIAQRADPKSDPGAHRPVLVFAGHTDVVPTGPLEQWRFPPFAGHIEDGMLHGRGAADMKGSVACFVTACERFVERHPQHGGTVGLLITSDEEGVARWGTREVMKTLGDRDDRIDMCIVGEPSSTARLGDVIKVGRRGSIGATLTIKGVQGHIAYPMDNPLHRAAAIIGELLDIEWDQGSEKFQPTSFQLSNLHGGTGATNVIPGEVVVAFNLRYSPMLDAATIRQRVEAVLARHATDFTIQWRENGAPFETVQGELIEAVSHCIAAATGSPPTQSTAGGTSDGRFIAPTGAQVVELGPVNATIHQIDEQVATADLEQLSALYENILERLLTSP